MDVPDPIPLDPARDVPLSTLGSTWVVAAGPSQPGAADFQGDALHSTTIARTAMARLVADKYFLSGERLCMMWRVGDACMQGCTVSEP